jgi:serine/threonine-protein kinase
MVGGEINSSCDVYALGVVMYEMIAGKLPYPGVGGPAALLGAILTSTPPRLIEHVPVPHEVDELVMRCLDRDPLDRFADVRDLAAAIDHALAKAGEASIDDEQMTTIAAPPIDPEGLTLRGPPGALQAMMSARKTAAPMAAARQTAASLAVARAMHNEPTLLALQTLPSPPIATEPIRPNVPYDMTHVAQRDEMVRRLVWAMLLVGVVVALCISRC